MDTRFRVQGELDQLGQRLESNKEMWNVDNMKLMLILQNELRGQVCKTAA